MLTASSEQRFRASELAENPKYSLTLPSLQAPEQALSRSDVAKHSKHAAALFAIKLNLVCPK